MADTKKKIWSPSVFETASSIFSKARHIKQSFVQMETQKRMLPENTYSFFNLFSKKESLDSNTGNHNITFVEVGYIYLPKYSLWISLLWYLPFKVSYFSPHRSHITIYMFFFRTFSSNHFSWHVHDALERWETTFLFLGAST